MGDEACWLNRICLECGRFLDEPHLGAEECPHCGAELVPAGPHGDWTD